MKYLLPVMLAAILTACGSETSSNIPDTPATEVSAAELTATQVAERLAAKGLPVSDIVTVTEENDDNKQLGRPGQYVSKAYFVDERYRGEGMEPAEQNTVETFANKEDATRRREYIEGVIKDMPMFNQYIIQSGKIVLRLDKALSPSDAKGYEEAI